MIQARAGAGAGAGRGAGRGAGTRAGEQVGAGEQGRAPEQEQGRTPVLLVTG